MNAPRRSVRLLSAKKSIADRPENLQLQAGAPANAAVSRYNNATTTPRRRSARLSNKRVATTPDPEEIGTPTKRRRSTRLTEKMKAQGPDPEEHAMSTKRHRSTRFPDKHRMAIIPNLVESTTKTPRSGLFQLQHTKTKTTPSLRLPLATAYASPRRHSPRFCTKTTASRRSDRQNTALMSPRRSARLAAKKNAATASQDQDTNPSLQQQVAILEKTKSKGKPQGQVKKNRTNHRGASNIQPRTPKNQANSSASASPFFVLGEPQLRLHSLKPIVNHEVVAAVENVIHMVEVSGRVGVGPGLIPPTTTGALPQNRNLIGTPVNPGSNQMSLRGCGTTGKRCSPTPPPPKDDCGSPRSGAGGGNSGGGGGHGNGGGGRCSCLLFWFGFLLGWFIMTFPVVYLLYYPIRGDPRPRPPEDGRSPCPPGSDPVPVLPGVSPGLMKFLANYDADGTGLPDLALESIGGSIVSVRHTKVMDGGNFVAHFQKMDTMHQPNKPNTVIQVGIIPGNCWAYAGGNGSLVIRLARTAVITSFHMEHTSKKLAPSGNINSAPRKFQVYGLKDWTCTKYNGWFKGPETDDHYECPSSQVLLGEYEFLDNGESIQKFDVQRKTTEAFPMVELRILTNHGEAWTCVYRFRVHGDILKSAPLSDSTENHAASDEKLTDQLDEEKKCEAEAGKIDTEAKVKIEQRMNTAVQVHVEAGAH